MGVFHGGMGFSAGYGTKSICNVTYHICHLYHESAKVE
jgi:hypothetical protein